MIFCRFGEQLCSVATSFVTLDVLCGKDLIAKDRENLCVWVREEEQTSIKKEVTQANS